MSESGQVPEANGGPRGVLDRLRTLATESGQSAREELAGYLSGLKPLLGRPWTAFPERSVIALLLWGAGRHAEAVDLATASLHRDGPDDAALQVVNNARDQLLNLAVEPLLVKRLDLARSRAEHAIDSFGSVSPVAEERALRDLIDYANNVARERARPTVFEGRPTVIHLAAWGQRFIDAAAHTTLPCCLAPGNVPRLAAHGTVFIHIHTRASDMEQLRSMGVVRELSQHARIELTTLPESIFVGSHMWGLGVWSRYILGAAQYDSLMFARHMRADVMSLTSEMLLSDRCLSTAKELLMSGHVLVSVSPIRTLSEQILAHVERLHCRTGRSLVVRSDILYRLSFEALHPSVREMFIRQTPNRVVAVPHQFHFPAADGFGTHALQLHPLAFSTRSIAHDIGCDFHTIDTRFPSDLLHGEARWYVQDQPPGDMYVVGLDSEAGITSFGQFEASPQAIAKAAFYWVGQPHDIDYFIASVRRRTHYRTPVGVQLDLPSACRNEADAIAELVAGLEALRPAAAERIGRYRQ